MTVVGAQWLLATANALGGGMFNFDVLWYRMPFAADYALSGSITAIHFTQADPWCACSRPTPSCSTRSGSCSCTATRFRRDQSRLAGRCCSARGARAALGARSETLVAGCLVAGLPVLASTQAGEAFDDMAGVAMLRGRGRAARQRRQPR